MKRIDSNNLFLVCTSGCGATSKARVRLIRTVANDGADSGAKAVESEYTEAEVILALDATSDTSSSTSRPCPSRAAHNGSVCFAASLSVRRWRFD